MGNEYWAVILGVAILVILVAGLSVNLVVGVLKRRRDRREPIDQ